MVRKPSSAVAKKAMIAITPIASQSQRERLPSRRGGSAWAEVLLACVVGEGDMDVLIPVPPFVNQTGRRAG